jgi:hypothetical protein
VTPADEIEAPAGTRSLAQLPFQLALPRDHLFGDWYGARTWLEERGITPTLTFVTDSLGNPTGGVEQGFTTANNLGLDVDFDLEKLCSLKGGSFLMSMSYRFGGSLSANYIHNVFTVQQVFGGQRFGSSTSPISRSCLMIASNSGSDASPLGTTSSSLATIMGSSKTGSMEIRWPFFSTHPV